MSEQDKSQRTEEATPRRKERLREEGKVPRSPDVIAAAVVGVGVLALYFFSAGLGRDVQSFATRTFRLQDNGRPLEALRTSLWVFSGVLAPIGLITVAAVGAGMAQTRGLFQISLAAPKLERLNPIPQLSRILPGKETGMELVKQLAKVAALALVVYNIASDFVLSFSRLASAEPRVSAMLIGSASVKLAIYGTLAFVAVGGLDYWLALRKFQEDARMSKQDLRDEAKSEEGDPLRKRRMRRRMRELTRRRSMADVSKATVLITNPTHLAVALRYRVKHDAAPVLLSKGSGAQALQMRAKARKAGVPIVENRALARALYRDGQVGKHIPLALYRATAEVIAFVLSLPASRARAEREKLDSEVA